MISINSRFNVFSTISKTVSLRDFIEQSQTLNPTTKICSKQSTSSSKCHNTSKQFLCVSNYKTSFEASNLKKYLLASVVREDDTKRYKTIQRDTIFSLFISAGRRKFRSLSVCYLDDKSDLCLQLSFCRWISHLNDPPKRQ